MDLLFLKEKAKDVRNLIVDVVKNSGGGHLGSSLSSVELLTYLYFEELNINCDNLKSPTRDKFLLSKGHAGLALACVGVEKSFLTKEELFTFNKQNSTVSIHLDSKKITADHGNADQMTETKKGKTSVRTAHSLNPVPFIIYDKDHEWVIQEGAYGLANVAPTVVKMMGLQAPDCWEASMV